jgi:hypothetical protein
MLDIRPRLRSWMSSFRYPRWRLFLRSRKTAQWLFARLAENPSAAIGLTEEGIVESVLGTGVLIQSGTGGYKGRVFYAKDGKRHPVPDRLWAQQHGFRFPDDVQLVSNEYIATLRQSSAAPHKRRSLGGRRLEPSVPLREVVTSRLVGCGIEFGAGDNPMPIPLHCDVRYADRLAADNFPAQYHPW